MCSELLNLSLPNLVCWSIIMNWEHHVKRLVSFLKGQGHSEGTCNQNMTCYPHAVESGRLCSLSMCFSQISSSVALVRSTLNMLPSAVWVSGIISLLGPIKKNNWYYHALSTFIIRLASSYRTMLHPSAFGTGFIRFVRSTGRRCKYIMWLWVCLPKVSCPALSFAGRRKKRRQCHTVRAWNIGSTNAGRGPSWEAILSAGM